MRSNFLYIVMVAASMTSLLCVTQTNPVAELDHLAAEWLDLGPGLIRTASDDARMWVDTQQKEREMQLLSNPPAPPTFDDSIFAAYDDLSFNPMQTKSVYGRTFYPTEIEGAGRLAGSSGASAASRRASRSTMQRSASVRDRLNALRTSRSLTLNRSRMKPDWLRAFGRSLDRSGSTGSLDRQYVPPHLISPDR